MLDRWPEKWRNVWIVGASSGIGRTLALMLAKGGVDVVISARRADALRDVADIDARIQSLALDVANPEAVSIAVSQLEASGKLPDLVIFCAAVYEPGGLDVLEHAKAEQHMAVNYLGAVALIEALVPPMKTRGRGDIAIVASLTSYCGLPKAALYGPTKAALSSLCESLRPEFDEEGLGLFLINPGFVATPMTDKNSFDMPFLMRDEEAAKRIITGLGKGRFEIAFPTRLALILRFLALLPYGLYFSLMRRMV